MDWTEITLRIGTKDEMKSELRGSRETLDQLSKY